MRAVPHQAAQLGTVLHIPEPRGGVFAAREQQAAVW
jgi:hypothetical protein